MVWIEPHWHFLSDEMSNSHRGTLKSYRKVHICNIFNVTIMLRNLISMQLYSKGTECLLWLEPYWNVLSGKMSNSQIRQLPLIKFRNLDQNQFWYWAAAVARDTCTAPAVIKPSPNAWSGSNRTAFTFRWDVELSRGTLKSYRKIHICNIFNLTIMLRNLISMQLYSKGAECLLWLQPYWNVLSDKMSNSQIRARDHTEILDFIGVCLLWLNLT